MSRRAPARRTRSRGVVLALAVVAVSALVASSCGGDSTQPGTPQSSATQPAPADSPPPAGSDSDAEPSPGAETAAPSEAGTADAASTAADTAAAAELDDSSATKEEATADAAADTSEQAAAPVAVSDDVPDLELIDVATGDGVQLRSLLPADTPVLFWFWAPH